MEIHKCFIADYLLEFIKTPAVIVSDQNDPVELTTLMKQETQIDLKNLDSTQTDFANKFADKMASFIKNHQFPKSEGTKFKGALLAHTCGIHTVSLSDNFKDAYTAPYGSQMSMAAQPMLNAAIRSHFGGKDYVNVFCDGGVCNNNVVSVRDKCTGVICNKDFCGGLALSEE